MNMKKFIVFGLLGVLLLPLSAAAIGEVLTESNRTTQNWCSATHPLVGLTGVTSGSLNNPSGLICDLLTTIDNLKRVLGLLQQLAGLRSQLQGILGRPTTSPTSPGNSDSTPDRVVITAKAKLSLSDLRGHYALSGDTSFKGFKINAAAKENSATSTLTFPTSCQVKYQLFKDGATTANYDSSTGVDCTQATSIVTLPFFWTINHVNYPLLAGNYRLVAEVIGVGTLDWYFKVQNPAAPAAPTITLTSPANNIIWATSTNQTLSWSTTNAALTDNVQVMLVSTTSEYFSLTSVPAGTPNDGEQAITMPSLLPGPYQLFLRLTRADGQIANSAPRIQVIIPEPDRAEHTPFIKSLTPASGLVGVSVVIDGTDFTTAGNTVTFGTTNLGTLAAVDSKITFTVPANLAPGIYAVQVANGNGTSGAVSFIINTVADQTAPPVSTAITITSPIGDTVEEWLQGTAHTITWSSVPTVANGGASNVNIKIVDPVTNLVQDVASVPNNGNYSWLAGRLVNGSYVLGKYRLRVCPVGLGECDKSNKNIKVISNPGFNPATAKLSADNNVQLASTAAILQALIQQLNSLLRWR
ncbi:MAG: hypothetical protein Q7T49_00740 [bacterium]|nr:hypothetical protein [bacterium]